MSSARLSPAAGLREFRLRRGFQLCPTGRNPATLAHGNFNQELCSLSGRGNTLQLAAVFVNYNLIADRQSQTRPFADRLGGKKGVKYPQAQRLRDARATVSNRNTNMAIGH